jgi:hypothetical protein
MALRFARGLFRMWLVLSVLWIGGVGITKWRTFVYPELSVRKSKLRLQGRAFPEALLLTPSGRRTNAPLFSLPLF